MPRVAIGGKLHPSGLELLKSTPGVSIDYVEEVSTESLMPMLLKADALLIRTQPLPGDYIEQAGHLKVVSRHGVGFDAVDVAALNRRHIPLAIVGDVNSRTVAEHAMTLILASIKRLLRYDAASRGSRDWNYRNSLEAEEVAGKTLLIIGYGRIGQHLANMAAAFGMRICAYDPFLESGKLHNAQVQLVPDLDQALKTADVVSIHVPATDAAVIDAQQLSLMKSSSIIINTARGGVVNEQALVTALEAGQIAGAGIDVFDSEPPLPDHPLSRFDQVILSPHSAGMTLQCAERMAIASAANIIEYFKGTLNASLVVNASEIGYSTAAVTTGIDGAGR